MTCCNLYRLINMQKMCLFIYTSISYCIDVIFLNLNHVIKFDCWRLDFARMACFPGLPIMLLLRSIMGKTEKRSTYDVSQLMYILIYIYFVNSLHVFEKYPLTQFSFFMNNSYLKNCLYYLNFFDVIYDLIYPVFTQKFCFSE